MKYIFSFDEINHGRIIIISDHTPSEDEVIDAVMNGEVYYHNTEYGNVRLQPDLKKGKKYTTLTDL